MIKTYPIKIFYENSLEKLVYGDKVVNLKNNGARGRIYGPAPKNDDMREWRPFVYALSESGYEKHSKEWENDIINSVLDNLKGTDFSKITNILY